MKAFQLKIIGRVQGVGFRAFVAHQAESLCIKGTVKNQNDGSVEVIAEGDENDLEIFINKCSKGSSWSNVQRIEQEEIDISGYNNFRIIR